MWSESTGGNAVEFQNKTKICLTNLSKWNVKRMGGSIRRAIARKEKEIQNMIHSNGRNWRMDMMKAEQKLEKLLKMRFIGDKKRKERRLASTK